jgi:hypothetical protein
MHLTLLPFALKGTKVVNIHLNVFVDTMADTHDKAILSPGCNLKLVQGKTFLLYHQAMVPACSERAVPCQESKQS